MPFAAPPPDIFPRHPLPTPWLPIALELSHTPFTTLMPTPLLPSLHACTSPFYFLWTLCSSSPCLQHAGFIFGPTLLAQLQHHRLNSIALNSPSELQIQHTTHIPSWTLALPTALQFTLSTWIQLHRDACLLCMDLPGFKFWIWKVRLHHIIYFNTIDTL